MCSYSRCTVTSSRGDGVDSAGDSRREFVPFYHDQYPVVLGLAIAMTGDRAVAEEIAQDAFEAAYRRWAAVGRMENPGAWVRRVVSNRSVSVFRRSRTRATFLRGAEFTAVDSVPEAAIEVIAAIRRLPRRQAQALWLRYFEDLTVAEVSSIMGCGQETVKTHLARGHTRLKEYLHDS